MLTIIETLRECVKQDNESMKEEYDARLAAIERRHAEDLKLLMEAFSAAIAPVVELDHIHQIESDIRKVADEVGKINRRIHPLLYPNASSAGGIDFDVFRRKGGDQ